MSIILELKGSISKYIFFLNAGYLIARLHLYITRIIVAFAVYPNDLEKYKTWTLSNFTVHMNVLSRVQMKPF
jgi:hypothetical protein